jgi:peptidylprolyl isomerase
MPAPRSRIVTAVFALLALSGVATTTLALADDGAKPQQAPGTGVDPNAAKQQSEASIKAAQQILEQAQQAPKGIPVPTGEVVKKEERPDGLILEDLTIGTGAEIKPGAYVVAHYHGTFKSDGKVFDSSFERGEPAAFPLSGVIKGWQEGVPGMKIGGTRRLTIPFDLAYGEQGRQGIPPKADLVFVIQLVDVLAFTDVKEGTGEVAQGNFVPVTRYTIKDAEGKVVDSSDPTNPYIWIPGEWGAITGGCEGMKVGGVRTIIVPKEMNAPGRAPVKRPLNVPVTVEVELLSVRNLN